MAYYEGMVFFLLLIIFLLPAILLGILEKNSCWYSLGVSLCFLLLILGGNKVEMLWLVIGLIWFLVLIVWYSRIRKSKGRDEKSYHLALVLAITPLALCKLAPFIHPGLMGFTGISYLAFRVIQILIELYDGVITEISLPETFAFFVFFPSFSSGPIDRSRRFGEDFRKQRTREQYLDLCARGIWMLLSGAAYKFILSAYAYRAMGFLDSESAVWYHWIGYAYAYSLYLFFDFAGYSRMAVGTAYILGVELPMNFKAPFLSVDIKDFWNRWHITLSHWFRDFLFTRFVMICSKKKWIKDRLGRACAGYLVNMAVMGMWHGLSPSYLLYGLYHGLLLAGTEFYQKKSSFYKKNKTKSWYRFISWALTMQLVIFGFFIFSGKLV